jgi:transposase-like protein
MGSNVTPRQRIVLEELLTGATVKDASERAGVARKTVYAWMKKPAFKAALDAATREILDNLSRRMLALGSKAGNALEEDLTYDDKAPGARVASARAIITAIPALRELANLEERVGKLEEMQNEKTDNPHR